MTAKFLPDIAMMVFQLHSRLESIANANFLPRWFSADDNLRLCRRRRLSQRMKKCVAAHEKFLCAERIVPKPDSRVETKGNNVHAAKR